MATYYEILGVEPNCNAESIKCSYKKLALHWHPDKNLDNISEANKHFLLIQKAYESLIDPQSRACYAKEINSDKNFENEKFTYQDKKNTQPKQKKPQKAKFQQKDKFPKNSRPQKEDDFGPTEYFEHNDNCHYLDKFQFKFEFKNITHNLDDGFYFSYAKLFMKIAAEEANFMNDKKMLNKIPKFGYSQSSYEKTVKPFYDYWSNFSTKKPYTTDAEEDESVEGTRKNRNDEVCA